MLSWSRVLAPMRRTPWEHILQRVADFGKLEGLVCPSEYHLLFVFVESGLLERPVAELVVTGLRVAVYLLEVRLGYLHRCAESRHRLRSSLLENRVLVELIVGSGKLSDIRLAESASLQEVY